MRIEQAEKVMESLGTFSRHLTPVTWRKIRWTPTPIFMVQEYRDETWTLLPADWSEQAKVVGQFERIFLVE